MGGKIDRAIGWTVLFVSGFVLFVFAWQNLYVALACAAALALLARVIIAHFRGTLGKRRSEQKEKRARAETRARDLLFMPEDAAVKESAAAVLAANGLDAEKLDGARFVKDDGSELRFALLQNHPDAMPADANAILRLWKAHNGPGTLIIANTGCFDEKAIQLAQRLSAPAIRLFDQKELIDALLKSGGARNASSAEDMETSGEAKKPPRWRTIAGRMAALNRRSAWRSALYGALLMALYLVVGTPTYLILSLALLALAAMGIRRPKRQSAL